MARTILPLTTLHSTAHTRTISPDQLCEMARLLTEPRRLLEVVLRALETPGVDAGGGVGVACREVFACRSALFEYRISCCPKES